MDNNFNPHEPEDTGSDKRHDQCPFVFVYGTLKSGGATRGLDQLIKSGVGNGQIKGKARTQYPDFNMVDLGSFPGVVNGKKFIQGEVWEVDKELLRALDQIEGVSSDFYKIKLIQTTLGKAWIYYLGDEYAQDLGVGLDTRNSENIEEIDNTLVWVM